MGEAAGRTILITGATDGLGLALARQLDEEGATVLVHGRSPSKLERVLGVLSGPGQGPHGYLADLSSLDEVRRFARDVGSEHERVDVLVNNAGVIPRRREVSRDGHELGFAVNHLAHFLLTLELLPALGAGEDPRVVNVSSLAQVPIDFDDPMLERDWSAGRSYAQSKLAQMLFTVELTERLEAAGGGGPAAPTVNALHPSTYMDTKMVRGMGTKPTSSVRDGMRATRRLAVDAELGGVSGRFYDVLDEAAANPQAYDAEARRRLWDLSAELTGAGGL